MDPQRHDPNDDELWAKLGTLPAHDVPEAHAERIRALGQRELERAAAGRTGVERLRVVYRQALEPAWVLALAAAELVWAAQQVLAIRGG